MREQERANKVMSPLDKLTEARNRLNHFLVVSSERQDVRKDLVEMAMDNLDVAIDSIQEINYSMLMYIQQLNDENCRLRYRLRKGDKLIKKLTIKMESYLSEEDVFYRDLVVRKEI